MQLDGQLESSFRQGFDIGMQAGLSRKYKFEQIGKLNVMLLLGHDVQDLLTELNKCDTDNDISEELKSRLV